MNKNANTVDVRKYYRKVIRRKYLIILPFIVIVSFSFYTAIHQKPLYESSTTILVAERRVASNNLGRLVQRVEQDIRLDILMNVILSPTNLNRLVRKVNLIADDKLIKKAKIIQSKYPDLLYDDIIEKLLLEELKKQITISTRKNFLKITVEGKNRENVYLIAKTLAELSMDHILENEYESIKQSIEFSTQQLQVYEKKLRDSEIKLESYQQELAVNPDKNSPISFSSELKQLNSMLSSLKGEIAQKRNELNEMDSKLKEKDLDYNFPISKNLSNLESQYIMTGKRLLKDEIQFSLNDPNVVKQNQQIDWLRRQMIAEIRDIVSSHLTINDDEIIQLIVLKEMAKRDLELLKGEKYGLLNLIKKQEDEAAQKPIQEAKLAKLKRDVETNREIYDAFLKQSQGSFIGEALQRREAAFKFEIIEPANKPMERANSRIKIVIIGGFIALIVGFALFSIVEFLDNSFMDIDEIENYLQLSVLGAIPKLNYLNKSRKKIVLLLAKSILLLLVCIFICLLNN